MEDKWSEVTKEELTELAREYPNSMIADMYGVSVGQVRYKRKKFGITMYDLARQEMSTQKSLLGHYNDETGREWLFNRANIDALAKAITQYAFRSGPVEQMHETHKFSEDDMMVLNKHMVNKLAGLLEKAFDEEWAQIASAFHFYALLSSGWDDAVPDTRDF